MCSQILLSQANKWIKAGKLLQCQGSFPIPHRLAGLSQVCCLTCGFQDQVLLCGLQAVLLTGQALSDP